MENTRELLVSLLLLGVNGLLLGLRFNELLRRDFSFGESEEVVNAFEIVARLFKSEGSPDFEDEGRMDFASFPGLHDLL